MHTLPTLEMVEAITLQSGLVIMMLVGVIKIVTRDVTALYVELRKVRAEIKSIEVEVK